MFSVPAFLGRNSALWYPSLTSLPSAVFQAHPPIPRDDLRICFISLFNWLIPDQDSFLTSLILPTPIFGFEESSPLPFWAPEIYFWFLLKFFFQRTSVQPPSSLSPPAPSCLFSLPVVVLSLGQVLGHVLVYESILGTGLLVLPAPHLSSCPPVVSQHQVGGSQPLAQMVPF